MQRPSDRKQIPSSKNFLGRWCCRVLAWLGVLIFQLDCAAVPYDPAEAQYLRTFLECDSMVNGKSNAEVIGADLDDPATWAGVAWVDYDPYVPIDSPKVWLPYKHVLNIDWWQPLGGDLEINGFTYLQLCWIVNTAGNRGKFTSIQVKNNPKMGSVYLDHIEAGAVTISGNPNLTIVHFRTSGIGVLQLDAPGLSTIRASTLGEPLISLSAYPELSVLDLEGVNNVATLDVSGCPKMKYFSATSMKSMKAIKWGNMLNLTGVDVTDNDALESLDLRNAPQLSWVTCVDNYVLTNLLVGNNPLLGSVEVTGNSNLTACDLSSLPALTILRGDGNHALRTLKLTGDTNLESAYIAGNALESLDVSGLTKLTILDAGDNQLTQFAASGAVFKRLWLGMNKLSSITANMAGHTVTARAYRGGGYVGFSATQETTNLEQIKICFDYMGLPKPRNTKFTRVEGSGLPAGFSWKDWFPLVGPVDATFYFTSVVAFVDYFATEAENPYVDWGFGLVYPMTPIVGDPIGPVTPTPREGFMLQGWYTEPEFVHEWDLQNDIVEGEMVLYPLRIALATPAVVSVRRWNPASETLSTHTATFQVKFNKPVSGVDLGDFLLSTTGSATGHIAQVSSSQGDTINVVVDQIGGNGTLRLDVKGTGTQIIDSEGNALSGGFDKGESYQVGGNTNAAFADYLRTHGVDPGSAAGALNADPDGDDLSNLMEFVLNGNPAASDNGIKPAAQYHKEGATSVYTYTFPCTSAANETYRVYAEYSSNLVTWQAAENGVNGVTLTEQTTAEGKIVKVDFAGPSQKLYVRLRVESK